MAFLRKKKGRGSKKNNKYRVLLVDSAAIRYYNNRKYEQMFGKERRRLDFKTAIIENAGRDMYVCIEHPDAERQEYICKRYCVRTADHRPDWAYLCTDGRLEPVVEIALTASLLRYRPRLLLVDVEAEWEDTQYHIYIAEDIDREAERKFRRHSGISCEAIQGKL